MGTMRIAGLIALGILAFCPAATRADFAYDPFVQFPDASNPSGPWALGALTAIGGTFDPFTVRYESAGEAIGWTNGLAAPNHSSIAKNISGRDIPHNTGVFPPGTIEFDGESNIVSARFTVPTTGYYRIAGQFVRSDYVGRPVSVRVAVDGFTIFAKDDFREYQVPADFDFDNVFLVQGAVIDFAQGSPQYEANATVLRAQVIYRDPVVVGPIVPEPSSLLMVGMASSMGIALAMRKAVRG